MKKRKKELVKGLYRRYNDLDDQQNKLYVNELSELPPVNKQAWNDIQRRKEAVLLEIETILNT